MDNKSRPSQVNKCGKIDDYCPLLVFLDYNHFPDVCKSTITAATIPEFVQRYPNDTISREEACTFQKWVQLPNQPGFFRIFTIISVLTILVVLVVLGNALVIAAVILRRRLRSATGLLILSLAVADLMVGLFILPFSIANEVFNSYWIFGDAWCTAWLTMDIWMCTASIYNLVAISIDRYIAIIKPLNYPMLITKFRARCIVAVVWIGSFIICSPSFLLASTERKTTTTTTDSINDCRCTPSNSGTAYILFSASSSFYLPMIIVIFVYVRIYIAACAATKSVYLGMMQVNKTPKKIIMQNPTALIRGDNIKKLRVHRDSTAKPEQQLEILRRTKQTRSPTQYNTDNIHHVIATDTSLRICGRYSVDDENFVHPSPPLAQVTRPLSIISTNEYKRQPNLITVSKIEMIYEQKTMESPSLSPDSATKMFNGAVVIDSTTDEMYHKTNYDSDVPEDPLIEKSVSQKNTTVLYTANPRFTNRVTAVSETSSNSQSTTTGPSAKEENYTEFNGNSTSATAFLHSNTTKKKHNYGANMINRLMQRRPRKKAGCAYEKRLSLEIKAAKTVAIVTGCFIFCWLGFSILYGLSSLAIHSNDIVWSIVFWLGYLNSALNPVIYTVFNREFRICFKRLLTCNQVIFDSRSTN